MSFINQFAIKLWFNKAVVSKLLQLDYTDTTV